MNHTASKPRKALSLHKSEGVVQAGDGLVEIGDPEDLEIVAELLSSDAVRRNGIGTLMLQRGFALGGCVPAEAAQEVLDQREATIMTQCNQALASIKALLA